MGLKPLTESSSSEIPDINHMLETVNTIFRTAMILPPCRRHAILKLLLTAVSFAPAAKAETIGGDVISMQLHLASVIFGFVTGLLFFAVVMRVCRGSRSAKFQINQWADLDPSKQHDFLTDLSVYTTEEGQKLHLSEDCQYLKRNKFQIKRWDVCRKCEKTFDKKR